jgi:hypothetical protein
MVVGGVGACRDSMTRADPERAENPGRRNTMIRTVSIFGTTLLAVGLVVGGLAHATSSTTSTKLSKTTSACLKHASADEKVCEFSSAAADCMAAFLQAVGDCFAPGKGASCAASCYTKRSSCDSKNALSYAKCKKGCTKADPTCKADSSLAKAACKSSLASCLLKCPQLP